MIQTNNDLCYCSAIISSIITQILYRVRFMSTLCYECEYCVMIYTVFVFTLHLFKASGVDVVDIVTLAVTSRILPRVSYRMGGPSP